MDYWGKPCVADKTLFYFFELLSHRYEIPANWYLQDSQVEKQDWFDSFVNSLHEAMCIDGWAEPDKLYDFYYDMKLPKSDIYMVWFKAFSDTYEELGLELSEFGGDFDSTGDYLFTSPPWETFSLERLEQTKDYFWFLVLLIQKFGSSTEFSPYDVKAIFLKLDEKGYTKKFNFDWFKPLEVWMTSHHMMNEFRSNKISLKSLTSEDFSKLDFSSIKPDDINEIPEYEINETYFNVNDNYYHVDKVLLAISAAGGMAQALERQDLEPKVTTVSSLLKKKKHGRVK